MEWQVSDRGHYVTTSLLEIVDLGDGEIALQRADDDGEALVTIQFSDETRLYIMDQGLEVAKAMIQAGLQAVAQISEQAEGVGAEGVNSESANPDGLHPDGEREEDRESDSVPGISRPRVLH
jgi:hypothetical protein